jgi:hypothetical protein
MQEVASVPGFSAVRGWAGEERGYLTQSMLAAIRQERIRAEKGIAPLDPSVNMLALSGGGANGAFGSGILKGWSEMGTRPEFRFVTGISTGALMAPFAFLGPEYDDTLKQFYTTTSSNDIFKTRSPFSIITRDSLASTEPLKDLISETVDDEVISAVAEEHVKGRRLFIATTNLDAGRAVVWDMGAIASSGQPSAAALFRKVMLASASIPVAFPPQYFQVEADGMLYDEMHVDGGVVAQAFLFAGFFEPLSAMQEAGLERINRPVNVYIIRNGFVTPQPDIVEPKIIPIAGAATSLLLKTQGIGDLVRVYGFCERTGMDFNLAHIPDTFTRKSREAFDIEYMNELFAIGYDMALAGYPWEKVYPYYPWPEDE